jgi:hypothetical protein
MYLMPTKYPLPGTMEGWRSTRPRTAARSTADVTGPAAQSTGSDGWVGPVTS